MSSRTDAPRGDASEDALARRWTLTAADAAEVLRARGAQHRLRCAVQLCALRATGRFVADYRRVPPEAVNHLARQGCVPRRGVGAGRTVAIAVVLGRVGLRAQL